MEWQSIDTVPDEIKDTETWIIGDWGGRSVPMKWLDNLDKTHPWAGWRTPSMWVTPAGKPKRWQPFPDPNDTQPTPPYRGKEG